MAPSERNIPDAVGCAGPAGCGTGMLRKLIATFPDVPIFANGVSNTADGDRWLTKVRAEGFCRVAAIRKVFRIAHRGGVVAARRR